MKGMLRAAVLITLVLVLAAIMAGAAVAKPVKPAGATTLCTSYIYADDPGWVKTGTWAVEDCTAEGGAKLLVANDAGATATYTFNGKYKDVKICASTYWSCGNMEIWIDGCYKKTVNLNGDPAAYGVLVYQGKFPGNPHDTHTVALKALGTGGPGGDLSFLHFVNVQYVEAY